MNATDRATAAGIVAVEGASAIAGATTSEKANHPDAERLRDTVVDRMLEKVMESAVPHSLRVEFEDAAHEIPGLSFGAVATALRKLNQRSKALGGLQIYAAKFVSWTQPAFTLGVLCIYTIIVFNPYLLVCGPAFALLTGVLIPGYAKRHPFPEELLPQGRTVSEFEDNTDAELEIVVVQQKKNKDLLLTLREAQAGLLRLSEALEKLDAFVYGPGSFVDEKHSSALFLLVLVVMVGSGLAASLVRVDVAIAAFGWATVVLLHPEVKTKAKKVQKALEENPLDLEEVVRDLEHDIVVDDEPEVRCVEIFELQRKGLTPRHWDPWVFSPLIYSDRSAVRMTHARPPGTRFVEDVEPPAGWSFSDEWEWEVDSNTKAWVQERAVVNVEIDIDDHWAYDYKDGERGEWRRRRWIRPCFRQAASPFTKPRRG